MAQAASIIELQRVSMRFREQEVLRDVSLTIRAGESFVLLGPSGMGKSVLLKLMAGLITPTVGKVLWGEDDAMTLRGENRVKWMRQMGVVFQKNALFDSLTVFDNVAFPLRETTDLSDLHRERRVAHFLEAVGLSHAKDLYPSEISGGMQKRLGIARALALEPKIIFYDDPTAGLDPITSRKIIQLIIDLKKQMNSTIITITNDMNRAYQVGERLGMVVDGELLVTGTVEETKKFKDARVQQFIHGALEGPLTVHA
ncbi:MAG: ATP-binding cassette domain-containing protein [Bdellovibrionia bacterium]